MNLAKLFAKNADELLHDFSKDGSIDKTLAHGLVAEIASQIAGNKAGSGFLAGAANEALINKIDQLAKGNPAAAQWISAALGATVNAATGGNVNTGEFTAQYGTQWNAYRYKPMFDGAYYANPDGSTYVRKDGQDIYVDSVPDNAYVWVRDKDNPDMGWEYFKRKGENNSDLYIDNEIITSVHYIPYGDSVYGFAISQYTKDYQRARIRELGREFAEAAILAGITVKTFSLRLAAAKLIEHPDSKEAQEDFFNEVLQKNW